MAPREGDAEIGAGQAGYRCAAGASTNSRNPRKLSCDERLLTAAVRSSSSIDPTVPPARKHGLRISYRIYSDAPWASSSWFGSIQPTTRFRGETGSSASRLDQVRATLRP